MSDVIVGEIVEKTDSEKIAEMYSMIKDLHTLAMEATAAIQRMQSSGGGPMAMLKMMGMMK